MSAFHILEIISVVCAVLNWCMVSGYLRHHQTNKIVGQRILLLMVTLFSIFSLPVLLVAGCFQYWALYPETNRQRTARLALEKLES